MWLALLLLACLCGYVSAYGRLRTGNQDGNGRTNEPKSGLDTFNSLSTNTFTKQENLQQINQHFSPLHMRLKAVGDRGLQGNADPSYPSYQFCPPGEIVLDVYVLIFLPDF